MDEINIHKMNQKSTILGAKKIRADPDYSTYLKQWAEIYQGANYDKGLAAFCLRRSHLMAELDFSENDYIGKVIEVGAGTGVHLEYVKHTFDEYWLTDLNPPFLEKANTNSDLGSGHRGEVFVSCQNATQLDFPDDSFDRLIATHVLEHLPNPHAVLREWTRVVKPGGVVTIVLPCDPGLAWRLGRNLFVRGKLMRAGFDYDYWMAREHINPINGLVAFCRHYFKSRREIWWPARVESIDINLFYILHAQV